MGSEEPTLGGLEAEVLRHIAGRGEVTVGEAADAMATARGLSRSTVVTVMERLRRKGFLDRRRDGADGVYRYFSPAPSEEVAGGLIQRFVERTFGGSLTPFVAYFADRRRLSPEEVALLTKLIDDGEERRPTGDAGEKKP